MRRSDRVRAPALAAALLLALVAPLAAAPADRSVEAGDRVLDRYLARELDDGVRLLPHDEQSPIRSIEIDDGGEVRVNGKPFDDEELVAFLGEVGADVRDLAELDADERRSALRLDREPEAEPEAEPEVEAEDEDEEEAGAGQRRPQVHFDVPTGVPGVHTRIRVTGDDRVSVGRSIRLKEGETAQNVVCVGCSIDIDGVTAGDATAVGGSVRVTGLVGGNATAVGGTLRVEDGAVVEGDGVAVGGSVHVDGSGRIEGQNTSVGLGGPWLDGWSPDWGFPWGAFSDWGRLATSVMRTGLLALLAVLALLILQPVVDRMAARAGDEPWKAMFAGLLTQLVFVPLLVVVVVVLAVSIIGIPLLLLVPFALLAFVVGTFLGFAAVAKSLGGWAERRFGWHLSSAAVTVIVGVVLIQATSLLGRLLSLPGGFFAIAGFTLVGLGLFLKYIAWTVGMGTMTLVALSSDWRRRRATETPPPPPPPAEHAPVRPESGDEGYPKI
jgi:hypothetical protein